MLARVTTAAAPDPPFGAATWSPRRLARGAPNWMFCVRSLPQPSGPANALDLPVSARTPRDGPGCRSTGRSAVCGGPVSREGRASRPAQEALPRVPGSGRRCQAAARASPALALRTAFGQAQPGRHRRLPAWRSIASSSGSAPIARTSCAQRQAAAILAAHRSASSREGTSRSVNPPMARGYGPSVTAPSRQRSLVTVWSPAGHLGTDVLAQAAS
jgi:hypothetical protein